MSMHGYAGWIVRALFKMSVLVVAHVVSSLSLAKWIPSRVIGNDFEADLFSLVVPMLLHRRIVVQPELQMPRKNSGTVKI